jgi:hypothetical protein
VTYFSPSTAYLWRRGGGFRATGLPSGGRVRAFFWDPKNADEYPLGEVRADADGSWTIPHPPIFQDWVLVVEEER